MRSRPGVVVRNCVVLAFVCLLLVWLAAGCEMLSRQGAKSRAQVILELDRADVPDNKLDSVMRLTIEKLRDRLRESGVRGFQMEREGDDRISVELPVRKGFDEERLTALFGRTARLEFNLVKENAEAERILNTLEEAVARGGGPGQGSPGSGSAQGEHPFLSRFHFPSESSGLTGLHADCSEKDDIQSLLNSVNVDSILGGDAGVSWGRHPVSEKGVVVCVLYVLEQPPAMTGANVQTARVDHNLDPSRPNAPGILLSFDRKGRGLLAEVTGANVNRQLAIVLDDEVISAPIIRDRVPGGQAAITGQFTESEARDIVVCLRAGALPAPLRVIEVKTLGGKAGKSGR